VPAPAVGAQLWERINPRFPFILSVIIALLTAIPAWLKFQLTDNDRYHETEEIVAIG
jgi:hypothetical protein